MPSYDKIFVPERGEQIVCTNGKLSVPTHPIIPFIIGDGIGPDIWHAAQNVFDSAVERAYRGERKIEWMEVYAGEKANEIYGEGTWLPDETLEAIRTYSIAIKGPLTTPVGGGIRSLNVALRQMLDLYVCLRPVRYFEGVPSPVKNPDKVDMVIFRENTEDIYAGIEYAAGTEEAQKVLDFLQKEFPKQFAKIRFGTTEAAEEWQNKLYAAGFPDQTLSTQVGIGIKPVSIYGTQRLVYAAIKYAVEHSQKSVTLVHKGNIMKFTEGAFRDWGYQVARTMFPNETYTWQEWEENKKAYGEDAANKQLKQAESSGKIIIKDSIADITLQQVLTRPEDFDVIATLNLNGDYLSDALAAQVGGIGIAPGANINYITGAAIFEATHGTAPKYTGLNKVNPGSVVLSGEMMLRYMGWNEAADLIIKGLEGAIASKNVTYDFARQMEGASEISTSAFGENIVEHMA